MPSGKIAIDKRLLINLTLLSICLLSAGHLDSIWLYLDRILTSKHPSIQAFKHSSNSSNSTLVTQLDSKHRLQVPLMLMRLYHAAIASVSGKRGGRDTIVQHRIHPGFKHEPQQVRSRRHCISPSVNPGHNKIQSSREWTHPDDLRPLPIKADAERA